MAKEVAVIWNIHKNRWGSGAGIGYNFIISSEEVNGYAKVMMIGDIASIRAHTPNLKGAYGVKARYGNTYIIGISMIGMLHKYMPTDAQLRSAHELTKELIYNENVRLPKLKNWDDLRCHKDFDSTACPGMWDKYRHLITNPPKLVDKEEEMYKEKYQKLAKEHSKLTADYKSLSSKVKDLQKTVDNQKALVDKLQKELDEYKKQSPKLEEELEKVRKANAENTQVIADIWGLLNTSPQGSLVEKIDEKLKRLAALEMAGESWVVELLSKLEELKRKILKWIRNENS